MTAPEHVAYPHTPGYVYDCPACEAACHCTPGSATCVYAGVHAAPVLAPPVPTINLAIGHVMFCELPYSEVCVHMRVAGKVMPVEVTTGMAAQLLDAARPFSFPIGLGEAGIYQDSTLTPYGYAPATVLCCNCGKAGYSQEWSVVIDWRADVMCPGCVALWSDWSDWTHSGNVYRHN